MFVFNVTDARQIAPSTNYHAFHISNFCVKNLLKWPQVYRLNGWLGGRIIEEFI